MAKLVETKFAEFVQPLAEAEVTLAVNSSVTRESREARSALAVGTIRAAYIEKLAIPEVREALLGAKIPKGTVSKMTRILTAVHDGEMAMVDVVSLNGAYSIIKAKEAAATKAKEEAFDAAFLGSGGVLPSPVAGAVSPEPKKLTPDEAFNLIVESVESEKNEDKRLEMISKWITKTTNVLTDIASKTTADDEEDE